jgi:hypothetical protein
LRCGKGEEEGVGTAKLTGDAAAMTGYGGKDGFVSREPGGGIGGVGKGAVEGLEERGAEQDFDGEAGSIGDLVGDGRGVSIEILAAPGAEFSLLPEGWRKLKVRGIEAVGAGVSGAGALALGGARAGGLESVGAIGGEALFGDGDTGHDQRPFR